MCPPELGRRWSVDPRPQLLGNGPPRGASPESSQHGVEPEVDALEDDVSRWHVAGSLDAGAAGALQLEQLARRLRRVGLVEHTRMIVEDEVVEVAEVPDDFIVSHRRVAVQEPGVLQGFPEGGWIRVDHDRLDQPLKGIDLLWCQELDESEVEELDPPSRLEEV